MTLTSIWTEWPGFCFSWRFQRSLWACNPEALSRHKRQPVGVHRDFERAEVV